MTTAYPNRNIRNMSSFKPHATQITKQQDRHTDPTVKCDTSVPRKLPEVTSTDTKRPEPRGYATTHSIEVATTSCVQCASTSVYLVASISTLVLAALAFTVSLATTNWSACGYQMKMGLWDFCISEKLNSTWSCYPVNTDFSVATQAFSILAAMCYACAFVLYVLYFLFHILRKSRPLIIGLCLIAFLLVSLQLMVLIIYGAKNRDLYMKVEKEYFSSGLDALYLSWSFYFATVSTILGTVVGVLLFIEFRDLSYEAVYDEPSEQQDHLSN